MGWLRPDSAGRHGPARKDTGKTRTARPDFPLACYACLGDWGAWETEHATDLAAIRDEDPVTGEVSYTVVTDEQRALLATAPKFAAAVTIAPVLVDTVRVPAAVCARHLTA